MNAKIDRDSQVAGLKRYGQRHDFRKRNERFAFETVASSRSGGSGPLFYMVRANQFFNGATGSGRSLVQVA